MFGISRLTKAEITEMIQVEKSSIYLSEETGREYSRYLNLLETDTTGNSESMQEMFLSAPASDSFSKGNGSHNSQVKIIRGSIYSYMLVAINRFIDQCHMWILQNFVIEYKNNFYRQLDQDFSPDAGTENGDEVKQSRLQERLWWCNFVRLSARSYRAID